MGTPGFTAERAVGRGSSSYGWGRSPGATGSANDIRPAELVPVGKVLWDCYPCMSGGAAPGALVQYCCDPVASIPGMSGGPATIQFR